MLKSFGHRAARLRCRFLIKLCLVLAFVALPVASSFVVLPSAAAVQPEADGKTTCDCTHLKALQIELRNAVSLQQAFQGKIADLRKLDPAPASAEFKKFADATANRFSRPAGDTGPKAVEYTPYGDSVDTGILETEKKTKKTAKEIEERRKQLCELSPNARLEIADMKGGAACAGIVEAIVAHEGVHWASCLSLGYVPFRDMHAAARAQEEVEAYGAQIAVLRALINRLRCEPCNGQWQGTITYTYIFTQTSNSTVTPPPGGYPGAQGAGSTGGNTNQTTTVTLNGTATVSGNNGMADASATHTFNSDETSTRKERCSARGMGGKPAPLVASSAKVSTTTNGGGQSQGSVQVSISPNKDSYTISIKPLTVNGTLLSTTETSSSGGCPCPLCPPKEPNPPSKPQNWKFGSSDYIAGNGTYGADRNILSGSDTPKTISTPPSTSTLTDGLGNITTTTVTTEKVITITWNLRRCK